MQPTMITLKTKSKVSGDHSSNPTKTLETIGRRQGLGESPFNSTRELSQSSPNGMTSIRHSLPARP